MNRFIQASVYGEKFIHLSDKPYNGALYERPNTIQIKITNVSTSEPLILMNKTKNTDPIPDINEEQDMMSVIYIHFPIGETEDYLTTEKYAKLFQCFQPYNWRVEQGYDPQYGTYFKLAPLSSYYLNQRESTYINVSNIISVGNMEKLVYVAVKFVNIAPKSSGLQETQVGFDNDTDYLPYFKTIGDCRIVTFSSNKTIINYGEKIEVEWEVVGKRDDTKLYLIPGDYEILSPSGKKEMALFDDTTIRLYTVDKREQISESINIYLVDPVIESFISSSNESLTDNKTIFKYGEDIYFAYSVKGTDQVYLNQGIGLTKKSPVKIQFNPTYETMEYILQCRSKNGLVKKSLKISCSNFLSGIFDPTTTRYDYTLSWNISNATQINIESSNGELISDKAKGSYTFKRGNEDVLINVVCEGGGGQVLRRKYTVPKMV